MLFTTIMEAYFIMPMEATAASNVESSLPTKEITGNPRGLKDFFRAALLIIVYSSTISFAVLAPESRTISVTPIPFTFSERSDKASRPLA